MKVIWIEHRFDVDLYRGTWVNFIKSMKKEEVRLYGAVSLREFKKKHGDPSDYDGCLMHPGTGEQHVIREFNGGYPEIPLAGISHFPKEYEEDVIPFFSYDTEVSKIAGYFKSKTKESL